MQLFQLLQLLQLYHKPNMGLCSLRKVLKLSCALLTLFLIYQLIHTFLVIRPTTTSKEEKDLDISDLPEVVICLENGLDSKVLENYGYSRPVSYFIGMTGHLFVGWNGISEETKSSFEILEEALIVNNRQINETSIRAHYVMEYSLQDSNQTQIVKTNIGLTTLAYPWGRCFSIRPPPLQKKMREVMMNTLFVSFNETVFNYQDAMVSIYFVDRINSVQIYPDVNRIVGNPLKVRLTDHSNYLSMYKTKMARSHHVEGDPLFKCTEYTLNNSYNDCLQNELLGSFHEILGCE